MFSGRIDAVDFVSSLVNVISEWARTGNSVLGT